MSNLNQRRQIVQSVLQSEHSDFYRRLYKKKMGVDSLKTGFPKDEKEWARIPFLEKKDMVETPVHERLFLPRKKVNEYRYSTGTSGGEVLVSMRDRTRFGCPDLYKTKKFMAFYCPYVPSSREKKGDVLVVAGEVQSPPLSARMARLSGVNGFISPPAIIIALIPFLKKENMLENVQYLYLQGDRVTKAQSALFLKTFPNASIFESYGQTELSGSIAVPCVSTLFDESGTRFHAIREEFHFELIDENEEIITTTEEEGEIVATTLWDENPQPMIRYRTGDMASYVSQKCECRATTQAFVVHGRKYLDRILMPKGELRIAEVDRVLKRFKDRIDGEYEVHSYEDESAIQTKPSVIVKVRPYEKNENMEQLASNIARVLRVTPNRTYQDNVDSDLYMPLECVLMPDRPQLTPAGKVKRFFRHQI